mmetsp:Transcript_120971/g.233440  ORF Transcript_120971/g.233440 Transcript_120971/m.233440 type:complete len:212 (-) Transcript_120971:201-836(-)
MSIKLVVVFSTNVFKADLCSTHLIKSRPATILEIGTSAYSVFPIPSSTVNIGIGYPVGTVSPPQPAVHVAFAGFFADPIFTEIVLLAFVAALSVEVLVAFSTDPQLSNLQSRLILELRSTFLNIGHATNRVPSTTLVHIDGRIQCTDFPQVAPGNVVSTMNFQRVIDITDPELTIRVLCAFLTARGIKVVRISRATYANNLHLWSTPLLEG